MSNAGTVRAVVDRPVTFGQRAGFELSRGRDCRRRRWRAINNHIVTRSTQAVWRYGSTTHFGFVSNGDLSDFCRGVTGNKVSTNSIVNHGIVSTNDVIIHHGAIPIDALRPLRRDDVIGDSPIMKIVGSNESVVLRP